MLISFVAASLVLLFVPGPTNTLLATAGARAGFRASAPLIGAEATAYLLANGAYVALGHGTVAIPGLAFAMRLVLAGWLVFCALCLWGCFPAARHETVITFRRVFITTLLNPKAMLVGLVLIPAAAPLAPALLLPLYSGLAVAAAVAWISLGARLPEALRLRANRAAAVILAGFAALALFGAAALVQAG